MYVDTPPPNLPYPTSVDYAIRLLHLDNGNSCNATARKMKPLFVFVSLPWVNDTSLFIMLSIIRRAKASLLNAICWVWDSKHVCGLISILILKIKKKIVGLKHQEAARHQLISNKNSRASRWKSRNGRVWTRLNLYHCMFTVSSKGKGKRILTLTSLTSPLSQKQDF